MTAKEEMDFEEFILKKCDNCEKNEQIIKNYEGEPVGTICERESDRIEILEPEEEF